MEEMSEIVKHVVVDTGAFIKNAPIHTIGENVYTLPEVVGEIRDKATRERLQFLPYKLQYKQPSAEAIKTVTEFAKKTGDYLSLSATDIKVIALTYQLEVENVGKEHIRKTPQRKSELITARRLLENPTQIAGFYLNNKQKCKAEKKTEDLAENPTLASTQNTPIQQSSQDGVILKPLQELNITDSGDNTPESNTENRVLNNTEEFDKRGDNPDEVSQHHFPSNFGDGETLHSELLEEDDSESDDDDDGDDGWITPSNIKAVKERLGDVNTEKASVPVGCLTTDFAMQNVLIQMGLHVISVNGMLIKQAKSYALRCFACMKITSQLTKQFCPHCGNNTLQKVSMSVEEDGTTRYFLSRRKPTSTRGLKYSLPAPKGGKHAENPVLFEDQPLPQQREPKKAQHGLNVFDPDYIANQSPFALNDTTSRAAQLGIRHGQKGGFNKRNPNAGKKKTGRRK